jgi:hypothetical protein
MRPFLVTALLALTMGLALAADKPVNTVCPVTGKPVDPGIAAVVVSLGKGERAQKVVIGVADAAAAEKVKANPEAYVAAARANRQAEAKP